MEVQWEDPPPAKKAGRAAGTGRLQRLAEELRANPGRWALAGNYSDPSSTTKLKQLGLEATGRKQPDGTWNVYARFVPSVTETAPNQ